MAYEMRISDWSSDVCSSDLDVRLAGLGILDRDMPFAFFQMHVFPLRQHQLGLAHQGHQDQLEGDLELAADVGSLHGAQELPDFVRRQCPVAGGGAVDVPHRQGHDRRSEEHTSELQSLMRISYAVFCLK